MIFVLMSGEDRDEEDVVDEDDDDSVDGDGINVFVELTQVWVSFDEVVCLFGKLVVEGCCFFVCDSAFEFKKQTSSSIVLSSCASMSLLYTRNSFTLLLKT
jgi:hypothetical protein